MTVTIQPTSLRDVAELVAGMREKDYEEVFAVRGPFTAHSLWQQVEGTSDTAVDAAGRVICLFGCTPVVGMEGVAAPWMLATHRLPKHFTTLCKHARRLVDEWSERYSLLTNATLIDNYTTIAWLKWLGFSFSHSFAGPYDGTKTFIQFSLKRRSCASRLHSPPSRLQ